MSNQSVAVVGGGIAGIQASIDLANMGFRVYLVEQTPSIGGRMAQLDKTFPTNDCSMCILAPKMIECAGHENVELLTYTELAEVRGTEGDFKVTVRRKPRYVDLTKCTGCGECTEKCPRRVPDEFNVGLDKRKAIYLPFPQAVPRKVTIDEEACLYLTKGRCRVCEEVCQAGAIDFEQQEEILELEVGALLLATGFDPFDPAALKEYGYGKIENVITGLEYERLICASGPTGGHLERPSDGKVPGAIAFIQCVGSRDVNYKPYCSSVCCMHATKEAILANEHYPDLKSFIFYTDMRAVGTSGTSGREDTSFCAAFTSFWNEKPAGFSNAGPNWRMTYCPIASADSPLSAPGEIISFPVNGSFPPVMAATASCSVGFDGSSWRGNGMPALPKAEPICPFPISPRSPHGSVHVRSQYCGRSKLSRHGNRIC